MKSPFWSGFGHDTSAPACLLCQIQFPDTWMCSGERSLLTLPQSFVGPLIPDSMQHDQDSYGDPGTVNLWHPGLWTSTCVLIPRLNTYSHCQSQWTLVLHHLKCFPLLHFLWYCDSIGPPVKAKYASHLKVLEDCRPHLQIHCQLVYYGV